MSYQGDIRLGQTIEWTFTTRRFSTGVPFTLAGTPSLEVYETGNSTPNTAGITLTVDYSGVTGLNHVSIVASSGNSYATANDFSVVIAAGTVDGVSVVGETVGSFSIENRSAVMPTTAGRTLDVTATGAAGVDWGNVENQTTAVNLSSTTVNLVNTLTTYTGNTPQTGDSYARIGATGSGLTSLAPSATALSTATWTGTLATNLGTLASHDPGATLASQTNITAGTITTVTNLTNAPTSGDFTAVMKTSIGTAVAASAVASVTGNVGGNVTGSVGSVVGAVGSVTGNVGGNVTGSVGSVVGDVGGLAAGAITDVEDAVWDAVLANHLGAGTAGFIVGTNLDATVSSRGTSTLTQTQVTGGAYALDNASFAFNAALDFTTAQKAATLARVTLTDTVTTYTGNTPQTGDSFARIGATGSGLTSLAPSATALSTVQWTNSLATNLGTTNATVSTNLDATITSRMATYTQPTGFLTATFPGGTIANNTTTPSWYSAGSAPTTAQITAAIFTDLLASSDFDTVGSFGKLVKDNLDATVSSRSTYAGGAVASVTGAVGSVAGNVGGNVVGSVASVVGAVGSVTGNVGGNVTGTVGGMTQAGYNAAADTTLRRHADTVEASATGESVAMGTLYSLIQQLQNSDTTTTPDTLSVFKTDDTLLGTVDLTSDASAEPVTGARTP